MEILADIVAGLGLFFIGVRSIGTNMKQMTGARFRRWVAWATGHHLSAALVGTAAGIVTQSSNAVTFISVSLVTSGMITLRRALPIVAWANVGTALLVFLATLDIHIEVEHHGVPGEHENVLRLHIAMQHVGGVGVVERVGDFPGNLDGVGHLEASVAIQPCADVFAVNEGHDVERDAVGGAGIQQRQDVRMREPGRQLDLAQKPFGTE